MILDWGIRKGKEFGKVRMSFIYGVVLWVYWNGRYFIFLNFEVVEVNLLEKMFEGWVLLRFKSYNDFLLVYRKLWIIIKIIINVDEGILNELLIILILKIMNWINSFWVR